MTAMMRPVGAGQGAKARLKASISAALAFILLASSFGPGSYAAAEEVVRSQAGASRARAVVVHSNLSSIPQPSSLPGLNPAPGLAAAPAAAPAPAAQASAAAAAPTAPAAEVKGAAYSLKALGGELRDAKSSELPRKLEQFFTGKAGKDDAEGWLPAPAEAPQTLAQASLEVEPGRKYYPSPKDWRDELLYSIMVDRFSRGSNPQPVGDPKDGATRHGGDIPGIIDRLDYLKDSGVTTLMLTPVAMNLPAAYHGYAPIQLLAIDPHMGTMADFKKLVAEAHARGMRVVLDLVVNHSGPVFEYQGNPQWSGQQDVPKPISEWNYDFKPADLAKPEHFTRAGVIRDWNDPQEVVRGDFPPNLRHYATDDPATQEMLIHVASWWIKEADIDGLRLDAIKHVAPAFLPRFYAEVRSYAAKLGKDKFLLLGEVSTGVDGELASYMGPKGLDSAYNYPAYRRENYALHGRAPTAQLESSYKSNLAAFGDQITGMLLRFLDNHDVSRFLRDGEYVGVLKVALAFVLFTTGVPLVYYGTEQAFRQNIGSLDPEQAGATYPDPGNREDMFPGGLFKSDSSRGDKFDRTAPTYQFLSKLASLRKSIPALRRGSQYVRWSDPNGPGIYAFSRVYEGQEVLVVLNTAGETRSAEMWVDANLTPAGTALSDALDPAYAAKAVAPDGGGSKVTVEVPAQGVRVLVRGGAKARP